MWQSKLFDSLKVSVILLQIDLKHAAAIFKSEKPCRAPSAAKASSLYLLADSALQSLLQCTESPQHSATFKNCLKYLLRSQGSGKTIFLASRDIRPPSLVQFYEWRLQKAGGGRTFFHAAILSNTSWMHNCNGALGLGKICDRVCNLQRFK